MFVANVAVFSVFVGLGIYGDVVGKAIPPYPTTTYIVAALCGIVGAVFIILSVCCCAK